MEKELTKEETENLGHYLASLSEGSFNIEFKKELEKRRLKLHQLVRAFEKYQGPQIKDVSKKLKLSEEEFFKLAKNIHGLRAILKDSLSPEHREELDYPTVAKVLKF